MAAEIAPEIVDVLDRAARLRALDPTGSFIVQAPAGSGKTELLIQRFLTLLATVEQPEAVLAITFTRKAAGEMRHRIVGALQRAEAPAPGNPHERQTWELARSAAERDLEMGWRLIRNPSRLRIQTIDAFCSSLVRQMPWMSRMGACPQPEDRPDRLYARAALATIGLLEDRDARAGAVERLLLHLDNDVGAVQALLAGMLRRRDQWLRHVVPHAGSAELRGALEGALQQIVVRELRQVRSLFPSAAAREAVTVARFAGSQLAETDAAVVLAQCAGLSDLPDAAPEALGQWLGMAELFVTRQGERRRKLTVRQGVPRTAAGEAVKSLFASIHLDDATIARLHALRALPPPAFGEPQWDVLSAMLELLPVAAAQLHLAFREEGKVDFTEVAHAARAALGGPDHPTDLAFALDCRIQHLLVDEFQDTSQSQYELLEALTADWQPGDGRTLFFVGDPMQSIYGFREADVGLFLRARQSGIGNMPLEPLQLQVNFRSHAGVVAWVNEAFRAAFPEREDALTGAVTYESSVAFHAGGGAEAVTLHPFFDNDAEAEADAVLRIVEESERTDPEGRIAVLVRARTHLFAIVSALRRRGRKFRAIEIDELGARPAVQDLLALTSALLHPADRIAWLAVLRAPWCGLTLADLDALAGDDFDCAIRDAMADASKRARLSADGRSRVERVLAALDAALALQGRLPLRRWVEDTWVQLGGPATIEDRTGLEDVAAYLDLLEASSDAAALADMERFRRDVAALYGLPDVEAGERLQLLTVHKAKGLEFDTVIVPGLGRRPRTDDPSLLVWLETTDADGAPRLLLAPIRETGGAEDPVYRYLRLVQKAKNEHESTRLLYVAATRARRHLHLLGHVAPPSENGELKPPPAGALLAKIWSTAAAQFERQYAAAPCGRDAENDAESPQRAGVPLRRLASDWVAPPPAPGVVWPATAAAESFAAGASDGPELSPPPAPVRFDWAGALQRAVGVVIHAMLRQIVIPIDSQDRGSWDSARWNSNGIAAALASQGVAGEELAEGCRRVEGALRSTLADARGRWLLARHEDDRREFSLSGVVDGRIVRYTLDCSFVADGVRWIVDYKSGVHEGGRLDRFLDSEERRYRPQLENYARLMRQWDSRPIRLGLYFPMLQAWREWEF